jgi:hypothetical protein
VSLLRRLRALPLVLATTTAAGAAWADLADLKGTNPGELANGGYFVDADTCRNCHGNGYMNDTTFLPHDTWAGTMMANAARDPIFFAALAIANQDSPNLGSGFCLRCHSPVGYVRGHTTPNDGSAFDEIDLQGIGCDTCHRMTQSPAPDDPYILSNAQIVYSDDQGKHGKYDDSVSPAHETTPDLGVLEARFCGQCHQVTNPERNLLDAAGADTGIEFPFETTFEEWQSSVYSVPNGPDAQGCVDCHMVKQVGDWPLVKGVDPTLRKDPRKHSFTGGNYWGIRAVMEANPERAMLYPEAFDNALKSTLDTLATAVEVSIVAAPESVEPGQTFDVTVRVTNKTGHKFPTGYVDARQAWVSATFVDCAGTERAVLGGYDETTGAIQASPATHVYRAIHGRWDGAAAVEEHSLALQDMHLSDTRIPPKGFAASLATQPSSEIDYSDGAGGYKDFDEATFTLTAPDDLLGAQKLVVGVEWQSMRRAYAEYLRDANTTNTKGDDLWAIYQKTDEAPPLLIASAETMVEAPGICDPGTGGGGGAAGTGGDATGGSPSAGTGGAGAQAGKSGGDGGDDGGCGCRIVGTPAGSLAALAWAAGALALARRRRWRRAA